MDRIVSTLAVEWIEILRKQRRTLNLKVSTLAVEWIEIYLLLYYAFLSRVSTLAVEWIEIGRKLSDGYKQGTSPPSRWSGLKFEKVREWLEVNCLHPRGGVD